MLGLPLPDPIEAQGLDQHVDWMSYSHQQLYDMVNNGVDLTGATDVAGTWAKLSDTLRQMGDTLNTALAASSDGWKGSAADQARGNLTGLVSWTNTTGENAVIVSGCVSQQAEALQTARSSMPVPPPTPPLPQPVGFNQPVGLNQPDSVTQTNAFAQPPIASPGPISSTAQSAVAHQQAARVMQQYQSSSADIARTIPQFASPTNPVSGPIQPPVGNPTPPPSSGQLPGPIPVGGIGGDGLGGGGLAKVGSGGAPPPEESGTAATSNPGSRSSVGATGESEPAQGTGSAAAAGTRGSVMSSAGLGGGAGRREDDREHQRKYYKDDDGIFDLDTRVSPRVIGEEKRD
ncbi:MAG TPA: PPE domain-containing protein [Pseudonocardiaceae bacterium]